ncbi:hypothetical protein B0H13DRAFT_142442 [Mycena leptocephala]|nr:hypothetical protein B0H13DRAFT_142442 [Mycena leptocephala]
MVERYDKVALVAFQELLLCFRKAHDDGIGLADSIVAHIDVLIVTVCSVEAVSATLSNVTHGGTNDSFSEANMLWWADKLDGNRSRVFRLLCDNSPFLTLSPAPTPKQIAHVRIVFEAARFWPDSWHNDCMYRALPLVVSCCTLSESDLSLWFPIMAAPNIFLTKVLEAIVKDTRNQVFNNHDYMLIMASVMWCAVNKLQSAFS